MAKKIFEGAKGAILGVPYSPFLDMCNYCVKNFRFDYRRPSHRKLGTIPYKNCEKNRFQLKKWIYDEGLKNTPDFAVGAFFTRFSPFSRYGVASGPRST